MLHPSAYLGLQHSKQNNQTNLRQSMIQFTAPYLWVLKVKKFMQTRNLGLGFQIPELFQVLEGGVQKWIYLFHQ